MNSRRTTQKIATVGKLTAIVLMLSLMGHCAGLLLSLHLHILPDGRVVVHGHPLPDKGSEQSHDHTRQEYVALEAAAKILEAGELSLTDGPPINSDLRGIFFIDGELSLLITLPSLVAARAPPLSSLS